MAEPVLQKTVWQFLLELNICISYISETPLSYIHWKCIHVFTTACSYTICNNSKLETTQISICSRIHKLCHSSNRILYSNENEDTIATHNMGDSYKYNIEWEKSVTKRTYCSIPLYIRFKNKQNCSMPRKEHVEGFWYASNFWLPMWVLVTQVCSLYKNLSSCLIMSCALCICYTSIKTDL